MSISVLLDSNPPRALAQPSFKIPDPMTVADAKTWHDYALAKNWELAIIHRLRDRECKAYLIWRIVNELVAESLPPSRTDVRAATNQILATIKTLRHEKRLFVYKRRYLAGLDFDQKTLPLEDYGRLPKFVQTGPSGEQIIVRGVFRD